jgi:hypothetical protein
MSNKRQRQVFPTDEIPHLWAHKSQESARNPGGNLFFEGASIYSYGRHFEIARHVDRVEGVNTYSCILLTTRGYSVTTASHISLVRRAISHLKVFSVEVFSTTDLAHEANVADYRSRVQALAEKSKRARSNKSNLALAAQALAAEANSYISFFGLNYDPLGTDIEELIAQAHRDAIATAERVQREAKELEQKYLPCIEYWKTCGRAGGPVEDSYWFPQAKLPCYLRLVKNHDATSPDQFLQIHTSWGATIPVEHGQRAYKIITRLRFHGQEFHANGKKIAVGHYQIESVDIHGNIKAGCHYITWDEIEDLAQRLGWEKGVVLPEDEATPAPSLSHT